MSSTKSSRPKKTVPVTRLLLIRHAEVEPLYQGVFGGRIDMNLSERGHEQATLLAKFLRGRTFDAIYASPMKRVAQTLKPLLAQPGRAAVVMNGLKEVNFGDWTGLNFEQVREKFNVTAFEWLHQLELAAIPNAETVKTFRARVEPCVEQILRDHPGQTVAIACHGGTIRMILSILLDMPLPRFASFDIDYASATWIRVSPPKTEVQLLNFTPWRDGV